MSSYQTINSGENGRPDLDEIISELNPPIGYIGNLVFPVTPISQKSGTVAYQKMLSDSPAQTNRSLGEAPIATNIGEDTVTVTTSEIIKRYTMDWTTVPLKGGVENADKIGAIAAVRSVQNKIEQLQLATLVDDAGTDITSAIINGIVTAAKDVRRYAGKLYFVCNVTTYQWLISQDEIKDLLQRTFNPPDEMDAILSIRPDVFRAALRGIFLFDDVLIADDNLWPVDYPKTMAVVKASAGIDTDSYMYQPEYGRTFVYFPEGKKVPYQIDTAADANLKSNLYDAITWLSIVEFASGAKALVKYT